MNDIEDLIKTANSLCNSLDKAAMNEKKFCHNVRDELERMNWETIRIYNDLKQIKEYIT